MKRRYRTLAEYLEHVESQDSLAARIGVSQSAISKASRGLSCSLKMAKRISAATGVPLESFGSESSEAA